MSNTNPGWYPDSSDASQMRYWDGQKWTEHTAPASGGPAGPGAPGALGGASATPPPGTKNWFMRHKIVTALLALVLIAIIGGAIGGGGSDDPEAASDDTSTGGAEKSEPDSKSAEKAKPKPKWKAVSKLSGNTNKAGADFHLNGCDTRMIYDVKGDPTAALVAFYVMDSGTELQEDGGFPVASPTETGRGQTVIRKGEGDYYVDVVAANAEWQVRVQEKC